MQRPNTAGINEDCDSSNLNGKACTSFAAFSGGQLSCKGDCSFDFSECSATILPKCGDEVKNQVSEDCDASDLGGKSCQTLGLKQGTLKCLSSCKFDATGCSDPEPKYCGDTVVDKPNTPGFNEECDKTSLDGKTCQSLGYASGALSCKGDCTFNTALCVPTSGISFCGDKVVNSGEACDTNVFGAISKCTDFDEFEGGILKCTSNCLLDTSGCIASTKCGNNKIESGELCDGNVFGFINECTDYSNFIGGDIDCTSNCLLDLSGCIDVPTCGNGKIDENEDCDGNLFGAINECTDYKDFISGTFKCNPATCQLDTSGCVEKSKCGNSIIDQGESCDGKNFGPSDGTCKGYNPTFFTGGNLVCNNKCQISTESCQGVVGGTCGNNIINVGEDCDGNLFGAINECKDYKDFSSGLLACNNCQLDTSKCNPMPKCGNGVVNTGESCDKTNLGIISSSCKEYSSFFSAGSLTCTSNCQLDTGGCIIAQTCGNGFIDDKEQCDGSNLGNIGTSCASYSNSFQSGTLKCNSNCQISTENCAEKPKCGNGVIDTGETCDGTNFGNLDGTCKSYSNNFASGNLKCVSCQIDTSACQGAPPGVCGDNVINNNEDCDGTTFGTINDCTDYQSFVAGTLRCSASCQLDTSSCIEKGCGNLFIDTGEECDKTVFGAVKKCSDISAYDSGVLSCSNECHLDVSGCTKINQKICGDGDVDSGEICDDKGPTFGAIKTCTHFNNFISGSLGCNKCQIDTTNCVLQPYCGNKVIETGEHCDSSFYGAIDSCLDLGFGGGTLTCASNCFMDTSKCTPKPLCGNSIIDQGEECDGSNIGPLSGDCRQYSNLFTGGTIKCNACKLDTSSCFGTTGTCGDGIINLGESCDGTSLGSIKDCANYGDFAGGTLKCGNTCKLDTTACVPKPKCGNNLIDPGEECDSSNLGAINTSCASYSNSFQSGILKCTSDCKLDTFGCQQAPKCGNKLLDPGETCDSINFGDLTDLSCRVYSTNFINGSLSCSNCRISTGSCNSNTTALQISCKDRGDCQLNEPCTDNSDCESRFCFNNKCSGSSCEDEIRNQGESAIDCGGPCLKCQNSQTCNTNSDCQSNFCSFGFCKPQESCSDSKLSPGESDVDCGGYCPTKCSEGSSCNVNEDCVDGIECISHVCKKSTTPNVEQGTRDTDGDGLPDEWEIQNGLNPNDPNDAGLDPDNDGLTNSEEFEVHKTYAQSTDPNLADTDGDGFTDKEEIDKGTSPVDPEDFPKSNLKKILMFIFGIVVLISGCGYLAYRFVQKRKEEKFEMPRQREMPRAIPPQQARQIPLRQKEEEIRIRESLKRREEQKAKERESLFGKFAEGKETAKEEPKGIKAEQKVVKEEKKHVQEIKKKIQKPAKPKKTKTLAKKPKEDVFIRLKQIAKDARKKRPAMRKNAKK